MSNLDKKTLATELDALLFKHGVTDYIICIREDNAFITVGVSPYQTSDMKILTEILILDIKKISRPDNGNLIII